MTLYIQPGYPTKKLHLTDEEYNRALQSFVKYSHDVIPIGPDGKFRLPERIQGRPQPGPWFLGGAVRPFTELLDSLVTIIERETGICFAQERFKHFTQNRFWLNGKDGSNVPQDGLSEMFTLYLTEQEIAQIKLDPLEYVEGSLMPYGEKEIRAIKDDFIRKVLSDLWDAYIMGHALTRTFSPHGCM